MQNKLASVLLTLCQFLELSITILSIFMKPSLEGITEQREGMVDDSFVSHD